MTLIQLIDHLKQVFHDNGDVDMEVYVSRVDFNGGGYDGTLDTDDITVDPEAKTITFT